MLYWVITDEHTCKYASNVGNRNMQIHSEYWIIPFETWVVEDDMQSGNWFTSDKK